MTKSFFPHFSTVALLHLSLIFGGYTISQNLESISSLQGPSIVKVILTSANPVFNRPLATKTKASNNSQKQVQAETVVQEVTAAQSAIGHAHATDIKQSFKAELRARIEENKSYPPMSRRLGQQGVVIIAFTLLEDGHIINARIDTPSPYERLNASALEAVQKVHVFKPIPKELGEGKMDIKVPLKFVTI